MNIHCPDRTEAAELFIHTLIAEVYDGVAEDVVSVLENGPPGRSPRPDLVTLHRWYQGLNDESKEHIVAVVREGIDAALFHSLVLLDGLAGRLFVQGQTSDYALYLQLYRDENSRAGNAPQESVRVNPPSMAVEGLHDVFHRLLRERGENKQ